MDDEWLSDVCRIGGSAAERPIVWSRRNGPWRRVEVLWVGAAPGNAGGRGAGDMGAHGTRIPFGGDIAGANLEVLLSAIGMTRNETFITAALNHLPAAGGGEPKTAEILAPAGGYANSIALLRDTIAAAGPALIVALGNVAARVVASAWLEPGSDRLTGPSVLRRAGWARQGSIRLDALGDASVSFRDAWRAAQGGRAVPAVLWMTHPSAQNMSPHAGVDTVFHARMVEALATLRAATRKHLGRPAPDRRAPPPDTGIYALPEWRDRIADRTAELDRLWRDKGI